jgi:hypothetical protein
VLFWLMDSDLFGRGLRQCPPSGARPSRLRHAMAQRLSPVLVAVGIVIKYCLADLMGPGFVAEVSRT